MEARRAVRVPTMILFLVSAGALLSRPQADPKAAAPADKEKAPIVRTDLLAPDREELPPPVRDIFRPKAARAPAARPAGRTPSAKAPAPPPPEPKGFDLELSYIGSVGVSGRIMALVLRAGQTLSVAEGDEIVPGYRVVRVTADEIVVEGPNSERKKFTR